LRKLFGDNGAWVELDVVENGNVLACVISLFAIYLEEGSRRRLPSSVTRGLVATLNRLGETLDRRYPPHARVPHPGSLTANYLVHAHKRC
jgi:hypothetical protein